MEETGDPQGQEPVTTMAINKLAIRELAIIIAINNPVMEEPAQDPSIREPKAASRCNQGLPDFKQTRSSSTTMQHTTFSLLAHVEETGNFNSELLSL